jgi:hypothetical protein
MLTVRFVWRSANPPGRLLRGMRQFSGSARIHSPLPLREWLIGLCTSSICPDTQASLERVHITIRLTPNARQDEISFRHSNAAQTAFDRRERYLPFGS